MRHYAFTAAMGFLIAAALVPTSRAQAASADPTGIWRKVEQSEHPGKFEIFRCGRSNKLLCAKIVWLRNPLYKGRPLHDIRNENPSMRDRPIMGLPIFNGLQPIAANQWKGDIYNPEDGNTYSVTLTLVSRDKIHLKGCKAWLLCGERTWLRTSLPKTEPEPETQIEASAEPEADIQPASAEVAAKPEEKAPEEDAFANAEMLTPAVERGTQPGYRFLNVSTGAETSAGFSGEDVPSMFAMTTPIASEESDASADAPASIAAIPAPEPKPAAQAPKPKPQHTIQATAAATPQPKPAQAAPPADAATLPADPQADAIQTTEAETAETAAIEEEPLTRRQRRLLRRQQRMEGVPLPWMQ